jgi:hypothetical protein
LALVSQIKLPQNNINPVSHPTAVPISSKTATDKDLVPYREWLNLSDPTITLWGPFEFATINQRKTRDRVSSTDWSQLHFMQSKYNNQAPVLRNRNLLVDVSQPIYEVITKDAEISARGTAFMGKLELNDETLAQYGHPVRPLSPLFFTRKTKTPSTHRRR